MFSIDFHLLNAARIFLSSTNKTIPAHWNLHLHTPDCDYSGCLYLSDIDTHCSPLFSLFLSDLCALCAPVSTPACPYKNKKARSHLGSASVPPVQLPHHKMPPPSGAQEGADPPDSRSSGPWNRIISDPRTDRTRPWSTVLYPLFTRTRILCPRLRLSCPQLRLVSTGTAAPTILLSSIPQADPSLCRSSG